MAQQNDTKVVIDADYHGKILPGKYSEELKRRVKGCITDFRAFDKIGGPAILYISAWRTDEEMIWYEYAGKRFTELLGCQALGLGEKFKECIVDRSVYKYSNADDGVIQEIFTKRELTDIRNRLREEGKKSGIVEAVYRLKLNGNMSIWLKDQAVVEVYEKDLVCLSLGCLIDVSKEMEAEDQRKQAVEELKKARDQLRNANKKLGQAYTQMRQSKELMSMELYGEEFGFLINEKGLIQGATGKALEKTGKSRRELLGTDIVDLVDNDSREGLRNDIKKVWKGIFRRTSVRMGYGKDLSRRFEAKLMLIKLETGPSLLLLMRPAYDETGHPPPP